MPLDQTDYDILQELKMDSRKTLAELSKAVGIPRATVHERIMRLKKKKAIKRFTIEQDYSQVGLPTLAFVYVSYDPHSSLDQHQLAKKVAKIGGILGVYVISGEWDLLIKVRGKSIEHIGTIMVDRIRKIDGILKTHTVACFEIVKDEN
jgi:DNA-binding Lrp family transcriptional regulator